jgi:hypothetical protein
LIASVAIGSIGSIGSIGAGTESAPRGDAHPVGSREGHALLIQGDGHGALRRSSQEEVMMP